MVNTSVRQLLVVLPSGRYVPDDAALERILFEVVGAKDPSREVRWVANVGGFLVRQKLRDHLFDLAKHLRDREAGKASARDDEFLGHALRKFFPLLKPILRTLLVVNPDRALPELRVVQEGDPALASLSAVGGHFITNVVYGAHPVDPRLFIRIADYHGYLLSEKRGEFLRVAAALGARQIKVLEADSSERTASARLSVNTAREGVESSVDFGDRTEAEFSLSSEFDAPAAGSHPHVPDGLRWLPAEPLWSAMADARIRHWQLKHRVVFAYSSDYSVDAKLAVKVSGLGLSCGGSFHEARRIRQEYEIEFHPRDSYVTP